MTFVKAEKGNGFRVIYTDQKGNKTVFKDGTLAWRNNYPGNLKHGAIAVRHGAIGEDDRVFAIFPDAKTGIAAQKALLRGPDYRDLSIADAIRQYSPDGNEEAYIANVHKWSGFDMDRTVGSLSQEELENLAKQMQRKESYWRPDRNRNPELISGTVSRMPPFAAARENAPEAGPASGRPRPSPATGQPPESSQGAASDGDTEPPAHARRAGPGFNRPAEPLPEPGPMDRLAGVMRTGGLDEPDSPARREVVNLLAVPVEEWSVATRDKVMHSDPYLRRDDPDHERVVNTVSAWFERRYPPSRPRGRSPRSP